MLYEEKPWLKNYPPGVPHKLDIPMDTVYNTPQKLDR